MPPDFCVLELRHRTRPDLIRDYDKALSATTLKIPANHRTRPDLIRDYDQRNAVVYVPDGTYKSNKT